MADKDTREDDLATAVHRAEREVGKANAAPAGPDRITRINRAYDAHTKAEQRLDHHLSGQAKMIPVER
jgi:hypothetical protein